MVQMPPPYNYSSYCVRCPQYTILLILHLKSPLMTTANYVVWGRHMSYYYDKKISQHIVYEKIWIIWKANISNRNITRLQYTLGCSWIWESKCLSFHKVTYRCAESSRQYPCAYRIFNLFITRIYNSIAPPWWNEISPERIHDLKIGNIVSVRFVHVGN